MKNGKLIIFNIILLIAMMNILVIKFANGLGPYSLSLGYFKSVIGGALSFFILWLTGLFTTLAYSVSKGLYKKNFLRINLLIFFILIVIQIYLRVVEIMGGVFCGICWLQLVLYIILFIVTILMLRDLQKLIRRLFSR